MLQIIYRTLWTNLKTLNFTLIHQVADISFYMAKYILGQVINVYKLKCPPPGGLG